MTDTMQNTTSNTTEPEVEAPKPFESGPHTLAIAEALKQSGPGKAERQLVNLGDILNDSQLAIVVQGLPPGDVMQMVAETDYTKPSLVSHFITPEQFLGALERLGSKWGAISGKIDPMTLEKAIRDISDFVLSTVLIAESGQQKSLLDAILNDRLGMDVLILVSLNGDNCPGFVRDFEPAVAEKGTWQEMMVVVAERAPKKFTRIQKIIQHLTEPTSLADQGEDAIEDETESTGKTSPESFVSRTVRALSQKAMIHAEKEAPAVAEIKDDVFRDV